MISDDEQLRKVALENARAITLARQRAEQALQEETRALQVLNETGILLASTLDAQPLLQSVTDAATELTGAQFGAFFYNTTDEQGRAYLLYSLSGAPREAFEKFGHPRATPLFGPTFTGERVIRCDDVLADPHYGQWAPHHGMPKGHLPVRSYLAVPVITRAGEVLGGLFFGHPEIGVFTHRSERIATGIAAQAAVAIDNARLYEAAQRAAEERRVLLEREQAARAQAEMASDLKDEFLANLSHELRSPLNAILGWAQMLRAMPDFNPATVREGLEVIERNTRAQAQLIEDLLDVSRITSGKLRIEVQRLYPAGIVETAVETIRPAATAKEIRIEKILDVAAGPIPGDPARLQQVMWNLLSNAVKFTPRGGKVQVVLERVNSHIEIAVADSGVGMSDDFLGHVFERFRQADASSTRQQGGLGLGLSIVKHLVELHGGKAFAASSGMGRGSTFTIHLPISIAHQQDAWGERAHPTSEHGQSLEYQLHDLANLTVLVVDDERDGLDLIRRVLADCGAEVITAESGEQAVGIFERAPPDVLVSDIGMPGMDGYALLRRLRAIERGTGRRTPAIALTAFARAQDRTRALNAGFLVHVAKPVQPSELAATVASVAGRTDPTD